ncbi:MAG: catalase family peroxidase [Acidobacteriia bacterium]|nr:catalase family peroxidase [Terriglobia bacterium]
MESATTLNAPTTLSERALEAFDALNGPQPGFRPAHAKGILIAGVFTPSPEAASITRAPHFTRSSTPVTVRFSDFAGIPSVADDDPEASPRGMAMRFHLADHVHTDIIAHSLNGFPARTAEEFVEFLRAIYASGPGVAKPSPLDRFLAAHPAALEFVQAPKPMPASFTTLPFFAVNAYRFTNSDGVGRYGRYCIRPDGQSEYLDSSSAAKAAPNYLFDEIGARLGKGPAKMSILVQLAGKEDIVNDSTIHWPASRPEIALGALELRSVLPNNDEEQRHIIFDPIPRVDGIDPSDDPLLEARADLYLMSGRRRRAATPR